MQSPSGSLTGSPYGITPVFTKVHWYREYDQIIDSADFRILRKKEVCTLVITEAFPEDSGIFKCVAENEFGSAASSARLSVSPGAKELDSFAGAAHMPAVQISMKKPSFARSSQAAVKDRDVASLPSYSTDTPGLGNRAEATNFVQLNSKSEAEDFHGSYENAPQNSSLSSYSKPMYKKQASINSMQKTSDQEIRGTKEALIQDLEKKLRCKDNLLQNGNQVSGLPTPDVMWYQNGRMVHQDQFHKMIVSEKGFHSFIFEAVKSSDAGTYECVAVNRAGESSFAVKVEVIAKEHHTPPTFIFKPQSKKVFEGDTARLECQISAIPTPRIYWKRNNEMVQYNTDRISLLHDNTGRICLLIHNANKKDAGWYTVSAVNGAGVATCHARLEVATHSNKPVPAPKQLRVRPTFSKYLALNGRGLDVKQAFSPEGEFQRLAEQSGLYESDEL
ncbi:UNVERIFIED_CONTAM: hypothetical protein H355_016799 [Colinus virginianus]|nr:hypothetical protein H355_016799 [Colinus virginianus]